MKCYRDLIKIYRELEKNIYKIEDWICDSYVKSQIQFLNDYEEFAKKYGEEYADVDILPVLLKHATQLKEQMGED